MKKKQKGKRPAPKRRKVSRSTGKPDAALNLVIPKERCHPWRGKEEDREIYDRD